MDLYEHHTHSFIVKIWLEETAAEANRATWRGHITHVSNGERRHLQELDDIVDFVALYLKEMGIKLGPVSRLRLGWRRWWKHRPRQSSQEGQSQ